MKRVINMFILVLCCTATTHVMAQEDKTSAGQSDFPQLNQVKIDLYPNPTTDFLNITLVNLATFDKAVVNPTLILYNIIGNTIDMKPQKTDNYHYRFNVSDLAPGYYLLAVKDPQAKFNKTFKFLKK